jgi:hypothetical protein
MSSCRRRRRNNCNITVQAVSVMNRGSLLQTVGLASVTGLSGGNTISPLVLQLDTSGLTMQKTSNCWSVVASPGLFKFRVLWKWGEEFVVFGCSHIILDMSQSRTPPLQKPNDLGHACPHTISTPTGVTITDTPEPSRDLDHRR